MMFRLLFFIFSVVGCIGTPAQSKCADDLSKVKSVKPTELYAKHLNASEKIGAKLLKNEKSVSSSKKVGKLASVKALGKGYRIPPLEFSRRILVPKAKNTLVEIAKSFYKKSKGSTLTYTSLTRTLEDQCRLRKVNRNAAEGFSTHNYGNAFDISYVRFNDRLENNSRLEKLLEKVLKEFENTGKIYYIKEKKQRCFHVTVRK